MTVKVIDLAPGDELIVHIGFASLKLENQDGRPHLFHNSAEQYIYTQDLKDGHTDRI